MQKLCQIRRDLVAEDIGVSYGRNKTTKDIHDNMKFKYRWSKNDSLFEILIDGKWQEAESCDFEFIEP